MFVWNGNQVAGQVHANGSWLLEGCGQGCFHWKKQNDTASDENSSSNSPVLSSETVELHVNLLN